MKKQKTTISSSGFSIVEAIVAMLVIGITVVGTVSMQYQSAVDTKRSEVNATASRIALLLSESWRGAAGSDTFDPVALFGSELTIETDNGPTEPSGFTLLDQYKVTLEGVNYFVTLSYDDVNSNLRCLNAIVTWENKGAKAADFDQSGKTFAMSVYANI